MNILIVEPKYYTSKTQPYFPVGPAYIAASLMRDNHRVDIINANQIEGTFEDIVQRVRFEISSGDYDAIAMGGLCTTFEFQENLFNILRKDKQDILLIGGGNLISSEPEFCFERFNLDFGILGEGEIPFTELCNAIENNAKTDTIPGLIYKNGKGMTKNKNTCVRNPDDIPLPVWELFESEERLRTRDHMPVFTSRSCPYNCTFCFHPEGSF